MDQHLHDKIDKLSADVATLRADLRWHVKWLSALSGFLGSATVVVVTWLLGMFK